MSKAESNCNYAVTSKKAALLIETFKPNLELWKHCRLVRAHFRVVNFSFA